MKDALGHGSDSRGGEAAHQQGVGQLGGRWRLNSYTHEIRDPQGNVAARMRLGSNRGFAVDTRGGIGGIQRSSGTAIHDHVMMADHYAKGGSFPADHINTELHYLTGNTFEGHTVHRIKDKP